MKINATAAFFDLDHTLLTTNCSLSFGKYLYSQRVFSTSKMCSLAALYFLHKAGLIALDTMQKKIFDLLFLGGHHTLFTSHIEIFLNNLLENSLYHPAIEELKKAQSSGAHVVLLSASPDFLVEKIAQRLNIPHWKASNYVIDNDGKFIKIASYLQGNDKAAYTVDCLSRLGIDLSSAAAYTDSILDLPFLETVGHPIAVQPDRQLRAICQRRQWRII